MGEFEVLKKNFKPDTLVPEFDDYMKKHDQNIRSTQMRRSRCNSDYEGKR